MSDIFISYTNSDRAAAEALTTALGDQGWSVFWDRTIPVGKTWDEIIESELQAASAIIVLWSHASVKSDWVRTEAEEGMRRKILIPALIEKDVEIPLRFRPLQAAQLMDWQEAISTSRAFELLVDAVKRLADSSARARSDRSVKRHRPADNASKDRDVFLGYSSASSSVARVIRDYLDQELRVAVLDWARDFYPGSTILDQIQEAAERCRTAVFLFTKDDSFVVRQNLIFEFGFFVHAIGRERVLLILEKGTTFPADVGRFLSLTFEDRANVNLISKPIRAWFAQAGL